MASGYFNNGQGELRSHPVMMASLTSWGSFLWSLSKQKVPLRLRVAGFLLYLDKHSFLQMDEENKLLPYMLILMRVKKKPGALGDLYAISTMGRKSKYPSLK